MTRPVCELSMPSLDELRRRRSEKWDECPSDVISSTVAEMDYHLATPIARVLHDAISRSDLGYAYKPLGGCGKRSSASRRADWGGLSMPTRSR